MFSKVLVGVDGRSGGRDAIALARQLVADDGRLLLAHVHPGVAGLAQSPGAEHAEAVVPLERERNASGADAETITIESPSVSAGLHRVAKDFHADLLVMGSTTHKRLGRDLSDAPCAVAIATAGYAVKLRPLYVVGVAYDGSAASEDALEMAREFVHPRHASIRAMRVVDRPSPSPTPGQSDAQLHLELGAAQRQLDELGGVCGEAVYGEVGPTLAEWSASLDLLVVASCGYGPVPRLVSGSTSLYLARNTHCSLLMLNVGGSENRPAVHQSHSLARAGSLT